MQSQDPEFMKCSVEVYKQRGANASALNREQHLALTFYSDMKNQFCLKELFEKNNRMDTAVEIC